MANFKIPDKMDRDRGNYFHHAIHIPLAKKYNIPLAYVNDIRAMAIHRKMDQQEICIHITESLQNGAYLLPRAIRKYGAGLKDKREGILKFLLRCNPEDFTEITRLTKWDWDYTGENRKLPKIEEEQYSPLATEGKSPDRQTINIDDKKSKR